MLFRLDHRIREGAIDILNISLACCMMRGTLSSVATSKKYRIWTMWYFSFCTSGIGDSISSVESVTFSGREEGWANCASDISSPWMRTFVLAYERELARSIGQILHMS